MFQRQDCISIIARIMAHLIQQFHIHPFFYLFLFWNSIFHTIITMLDPDSELFMIIKWLDLTLLIDPEIILYILIGPTLIGSIGIIWQIIIASISKQIHHTVISEYVIKVSMIINFTLVNSFMLPILQSSLLVMKQTSSTEKFGINLISGFQLGLFLLFTFTSVGLCYFEQSPASEKMYACLEYSSAYKIYHVFRLIVILVFSAASVQYTVIPVMIFFPILLVFLLKSPIFMCRFNTSSQCGFGCILWIMLTRIVELAYGTTLPSTVVIIGCPMFALFLLYILNKRVEHIVNSEKIEVEQMRIIYKMMSNFPMYQKNLQAFLLIHYRSCEFTECYCRRIMEFIGGEEETMEKMNVKEKRQQRNAEEIVLWYQFIHFLLDKHFNYEELNSLPTTQRLKRIQSIVKISMDKMQILREKLHRRHHSLLAMWRMKAILQRQKVEQVCFLARYYLNEYNVQRQMRENFKKGDGIQLYAWNYYNLQFKCNEFRVFLFKISKKIVEFWDQMCSQIPDQSKIMTLIDHIYKINTQLTSQYKVYKKLSKNTQGNSEYERKWGIGTKALIDTYYIPFLKVIQGNDNTQLINELEQTLNQFRISQPDKIYSRQIQFFNTNSGTAMAIVSVMQGDTFGNILVGNVEFWETIKSPRYENMNYSRLLLKEISDYHHQMMLNFLNRDQYYLGYVKGYIVNIHGYLMEVEFNAQLNPNIYDGLKVAIFLKALPEKTEFILNKNSKLIAFTRKFEGQVLTKISEEEFDDVLTKECVEFLEENGQMDIEISSVGYHVHCQRHKNFNLEKPDNQKHLYFCTIHQKNQNLEIQNFDQTQSLYLTKLEESFIEDEAKKKNEQRSSIESMRQRKNSQTQRINQQKLKMKETLKKAFKIVENNQQCRNIQRWVGASFFVFLILSTLSFLILGFTISKIQDFRSVFTSYKHYQKLVTSLADAPYYSRSINELAYESTDFSNQKQKLKLLNDDIETSLKNTTVFSESTMINFMQITQDNNINVIQEPLSAVLLKYVIAAFTYTIEHATSLNFDYIKTNIGTPYTAEGINFYRSLYNSIYICFPYIQENREKYLQEESCKINCFKNQITVIVGIIGFILCLFCVIVSYCIVFKISRLKDFSLVLISNVKYDKLNEKKERIKYFLQTELEDLMIYDVAVLEKTQKQKNKIQRSNCKGKSEFFMDTGQNVTERDLMKKVNSIREKKRKVLKITMTSKLNIMCKLLLIFSPILILFLCLICLHLSYNTQIANKLEIQKLISKRMEYLRIIKTLDKEIGLERNVTGFESQRKISLQLENYINKLYGVERSFQNKIVDLETSDSLRQLIEAQNNAPLCELAFEKQVEVEDQVFFYSRSDCDSVISDNFISEGVSATIVFFQDTSTNIQSHYKNAQSLSDSAIRQFVSNRTQEDLEKIVYFLTILQENVKNLFDQELQKSLETFQIVVIILTIFNVLFLWMIFVFAIRRCKQQMYYNISIVKTLFHLLSYKEIEEDYKLEEMVVNNIEQFQFIK